MSEDAVPWAEQLSSLRRAFDHSFALPVRTQSLEIENILAVRAGGVPYGLVVGEITSVATLPRIVPLPTRNASLLGLTGLRGSLQSPV